MRSFKALLLGLVVGSLALIHIGHAGEPLKIRQGWVVSTTFSPMIFSDPGILRHYGKSYVVEPVHFAGSSPELTALATGEVDLITIAYATLPIAVENAHITDLRIVADGFQDGVEGYLSQPYLVRNDGSIKTVEDLRGKAIAINQLGGVVDIAARAMLRRHGLEAGKDYTIVEAPFPVMAPMLLQKKVALVSTVPPFLYEPALESKAHALFTMKEAMGPSQLIMLAARASFLKQHRAALDDFFEDLVRGTRWMETPANRDKAIALAARFAKAPPQRIAGYFLTKKDEYRDPNCLPNIAAVQRNIDTEREIGLLKSDFDVSKYVDLSFVKRAAKRLDEPSR
ncbi:MAG TPA: ABC transporter substrate-binding protein [Stellaceae bacterium]|nr:ABC transporter substrate-binding protein [Stellaceae bacterium]